MITRIVYDKYGLSILIDREESTLRSLKFKKALCCLIITKRKKTFDFNSGNYLK